MAKLLIMLTLCPFWARAQMETTQVLPKGVASPQISIGTAAGLSERFNGGGQITSVTDRYQFDLNGKNLSRVNGEARRLVHALNQFSSQDALGDRYSAGRLEFQAKPQLEYFVPTIAYGVTNDLSVGFGIPIVRFRNEVTPTVSGPSNHNEIKDLVKGTSTEVDEGLEKLRKAVNEMPSTVNQALEARGYKPLRPVEYTAIGDFTLAAVYRYFKSERWGFAVKPWMQLPTGRRDDPDDVVDSAVGGQPALGVKSIHDFRLTRHWALHQAVGVVYNIPDTVEMRVPQDNEDILPGPESKEMVRRKTGDAMSAEIGTSYRVLDPLTVSTFYGYEVKSRDVYNGERSRDYGYLGRDTQGTAHKLYASVEFSTVDLFIQKQVAVPMSFGYVYSNTLGGENTRNQVSHHLSLRMFF